MTSEKSSGVPVSSRPRILAFIGWGILILCGLVVCSFISLIGGGIFLGILMSSGESELHSVANSSNQIIALAISDGCGATCGCTVRVDVKTDDQYVKEVWRGIDICDITITWLTAAEFTISANGEQQAQIDVRSLGLSP